LAENVETAVRPFAVLPEFQYLLTSERRHE
jgi:hypothetical protein